MLPIRIKACSESDLRMLGNLARNIQRVLPVTQADIDAAAALGKGWVVWKVIEVTDPIDNLRGGTQLVIKQNSITPGQNVRRVLIVSGPGGETVVIGPGSSPLLLPDAIADSLTYVKAFGGTEQRNLPAGYTQLEYIESTGTELIDLGLKWTYGTSTKTVCEMLDRQSTAFGCVGARNSTSVVWGNFQSNTDANYTCFGDKANITFSQNMVDGNYHTWETNNIGFYLDGVQKTDLSGSNQTLVSTDNICLFGRYDGAGNIERCGKWRIKSHQTSVDNTLTQDLIPAKRNSDSVIGMYDTVSGTFFTNAGTGAFTAGPTAVPTPDAPIDIVSNNGVLKANTNLYRTEYKGYQLSQVDGITVTENAGVDVSGMVDCRTIKSFKITTVSPQGSFRIFRYRADNTFINSAATANIGDVITLEDNVGFFRIQYNFTNSEVGTENILIYDSAYNLNEVYTDGTVETIKDSLNNTATAEMLLKVGDYQDVQSILDGVVTRNVGVKVLDGTENWGLATAWGTHAFSLPRFDGGSGIVSLICSHNADYAGSSIVALNNQCTMRGSSFILSNNDYTNTSAADFKQWLADQYAAGTPVIVLYPLATPTTESVTGQTLQVQDGDNTLEITQASLSGLELEAEYQKVA